MHIETLPRRRHTISLTPLIDVVFILLLFFMLATNFTDWREITLATGTTASTSDNDKATAIVRVTPDGGLYYKGQDFSVDTLIPVLLQLSKDGKLAAVIVHPAADTTLGPTVNVLDALAGTGLPVALSRTKGPGTAKAP